MSTVRATVSPSSSKRDSEGLVLIAGRVYPYSQVWLQHSEPTTGCAGARFRRHETKCNPKKSRSRAGLRSPGRIIPYLHFPHKCLYFPASWKMVQTVLDPRGPYKQHRCTAWAPRGDHAPASSFLQWPALPSTHQLSIHFYSGPLFNMHHTGQSWVHTLWCAARSSQHN